MKAILIVVAASIGWSAAAMNCPIGWAAVHSLGQNGTTGGGDGPVVHVSTKSALASYAGMTAPCTIIVDSTAHSSFSTAGNITVRSHKTIVGANAGIVFEGFGLDINTQTNIILRNLTIRNANPDAISIRASHHLWIDHCDLSACSDGLLDITIGSDYATVSRTKFHHHDKVTLANSGTGHFEDAGRNRVTYHHNWFADNVQRNPRIGYGKAHLFNNYYTNISSYCVGFHTGASVLVESNYFRNSSNPLQQSYSSNPWDAAYADARSVGNVFVSCSGSTAGTGKSFDPEIHYSYKFAAHAASDVPSVVMSSAGMLATGATHVICPVPGNGGIDVIAELGQLRWTGVEGAVSWDVYFGASNAPAFLANQTARVFDPGSLAPNTEYFWKVVAHTPGGTITSHLWRFRTAPSKASKPFPADGELHSPLRVPSNFTSCKALELAWTAAFGALSNRVYLGTAPDLNAGDYRGVASQPAYAPGPLRYGQTYYWRVDAVKSNGVVEVGDTWVFKSDVVYSTQGRTEAEDMVRSSGTYHIENDTGWFPASEGWTARLEAGPGTLSSVWAGPDSICSVRVTYFDESDGRGWFGFYVNEQKRDEWFASANNDQLSTRVINNVRLSPGDELRIAAYSDSGELNRTDCMDIFVSNAAPVLVSIPDQFVNAGTTVVLTNVAADADLPAQQLAFSLIEGPFNATLSSANGVFTWRPLITQAGASNRVTVVVQDSHATSLSATQTFSIVVNSFSPPSLSAPVFADGQVTLTASGQAGPDYAVEVSADLVNWETLVTTNSPPMPFTWNTAIDAEPAQFYRIQAGPALP